MTLLIVSIFVAMTCCFLCSLAEAVLLSLTPAQIAEMAKKHPGTARVWQRHKGEIQRPIAVILMINTAAGIFGASVSGVQFEHLAGKQWLVLYSLCFSFLILQFSEILPKTLGVRYSGIVALFIARPLAALVTGLAPVVAVLRWFNRPFEGRGSDARTRGTLSEITALASLARLSNLIGRYEEKIIKNAAAMSATSVSEVMIPSRQITFLSTTQTMTEAILTAHFDPHTRFPICEAGDHDHVLGYVNFKELIYRARTNPSDPSLRGIIRPVRFTTPNDTAAELLRAFVDEHVHVAIVRDEEGKTLGLVTMEDLVEELVGELEDEFDRLPRMCHALSGGTWMVGGGYPVERLQEQLGVPLTDPHGGVSAWLIARFGRIPNANEVYRESGLEFLVRRTRRGKIFEVAVTPPRPGGGDELLAVPEL